MFLKVDRRPDKDFVYARCLGKYRVEDNVISTGIKPLGDRICPAVENNISLDVETWNSERGHEEKATTDNGETVSMNADIRSQEHFDRPADFKGKSWKLSSVPKKITVKKEPKSDGSATHSGARSKFSTSPKLARLRRKQ